MGHPQVEFKIIDVVYHLRMDNKVIRNISVAIAGIFEKCCNLMQQDAPKKKRGWGN
jgi:hypothetical protein